MKEKKIKGFYFFYKALQSARTQMWISLQVLLVITGILAVVLYFVEHAAQPHVYTNLWDSMVWSLMAYLGNPGKFACGDPITIFGRIIWIIICLLKIALFAVPAGLIANGFRQAMEEDKRKRYLESLRMRLTKAFSRKPARRINDYRLEKGESDKFYITPTYESIIQLQVKYQLDTKDILEACKKFPEFRLANMASIQTEAENPVDRLVTLYSPNQNRPYGCCINRNSKITIVATSAYAELPTEWFSYYLAMFGGFNYIGRSVVEDIDNAHSYYNMQDHTDDAHQQLFYNDLKLLTQGDDHWTIYLLQQVTNSTKGGNHIQFSSSMRDGKEPTICDETTYNLLKQSIVKMFEDYNFNFSAEESVRFPLTKNNIAYRLRKDGVNDNSFTLRIGAHIMAKHTFRELIAYRIAENINTVLSGKGMTEDDRKYLSTVNKK